MNKRTLFDFFFYATFSSIYIISYLKETSEYTVATYEKYGFTGHKTYGGRWKFITFINLVNWLNLIFKIYIIA